MKVKIYIHIFFLCTLLSPCLQAQTKVSYPELSLVSVNIPSWFTDIQVGKYTGISMPYGSETDAICMAVMQKLLATDLEIWRDSYFSESQQHYEYAQYRSTHDSCEISINTIVCYDIEEMKLLPSKEYICRITDGNQYKSNLNLTCKKNEVSHSSRKKIGTSPYEREMVDFFEWEIQLTFGDTQYKFRMMEHRKQVNRSTEIDYISAFLRGNDVEQPDYAYQTQCMYGSKPGEKSEEQSTYKFNSKSLSFEEGLGYYSRSMHLDSKQCLAERLLTCYIEMLCGEPNNYRGLLTRRKTPVVMLNYAYGFITVFCQPSEE